MSTKWPKPCLPSVLPRLPVQGLRAGYLRAAGAAALLTAAVAGARAQSVPVSLGQAAGFGVLAGSTVTNTGSSVVYGNVGVTPGTAMTGFTSGTIIGGAKHANDSVATQAQTDLTAAYNTIAGETPTQSLTGLDLGSRTLTPGVYFFSSSAQLTGALTLDALGDPNARFDFQIGSTLTTAPSSSVTMMNGGSVENVFWQVGDSATIDTNTAFQGNLLALTSITFNNGATDIGGRALARNGAITLDTNTIGASAAAPEPSAAAYLVGLGLPAAFAVLRRHRTKTRR